MAPVSISVDPYTNPSGQHETAVEPDSFSFGNTVVAAFQLGRFPDGGASGIGWATSLDGGATWRSGVLPHLTVRDSPPGPHARATDPAVAFDRVHGVWLISVLALDDVPAVGETSSLIVSRSVDGLSWSEPTTTAPDLGFFAHDKNWIACDNGQTSPFAGRCYLTWTDTGLNGGVAMSTSADGGLTWGKPLLFARSNISGTQPVVQPNGIVVVPYLAAAAIEALRSTDGGDSLTSPVTVSRLSSSNPPGLRAPPLPSAEVAADGRVFVAWQDCRFRPRCQAGARSGPNDIVVSSSADGTRWTEPARVPIDPLTSGIDHVLPGLAVDATTAGASTRLALVYYTVTPAGCTGDTCSLGAAFVASRDAGRTWSAPLPLGPRSRLDALASTTGGWFVGDYVSTSFVVGGAAVPVYSIATAPFDGRFHQFVFAARVPPQPARAAVTISGVRATPARPRAGRVWTVAATLRVSGSPVAARVVCRARLGGRVLRVAASRLASGRATCRWRIPERTRGKRLSGSVQVVYVGGAPRRAFAYRVA